MRTLLAALLPLLAAHALAGDLTPPPGPPAPTMKTLAEVEPRTPITQADIPLTITQPGSYYLAGNISSASSFAIRITAPSVTLDLEGFTIAGAGADLSSGVIVSGANAVVRNGRVTNLAFAVDCSSSTRARVESLVISDAPPAAPVAVGVTPGINTRITRCEIHNIGATGNHYGVLAPSVSGLVLEDTVISRCGRGVVLLNSPNCHVRDCTFTDSPEGAAVSVAGASHSALIADCRITGQGLGLSLLSGSTRCAFVRNIASGNTTNFSNIPNVSTNPVTAAPNDNLSY